MTADSPNKTLTIHGTPVFVPFRGSHAGLACSALIARKPGTIRLLLVASPACLERQGVLAHPADLSAHVCIRDTNMRGDGSRHLTGGGLLHRVAVRLPDIHAVYLGQRRKARRTRALLDHPAHQLEAK